MSWSASLNPHNILFILNPTLAVKHILSQLSCLSFILIFCYLMFIFMGRSTQHGPVPHTTTFITQVCNARPQLDLYTNTHRKTQQTNSTCFQCLQRTSQGITGVIRIYTLGTMNVCKKKINHSNLSGSCRDISLSQLKEISLKLYDVNSK